MEKPLAERAEGVKGPGQDGLAYVFKDGRIVRAVPPESIPAPAVQAGPGLQSDIPLPVLPPQPWRDRSKVCRCCADDLNAMELSEDNKVRYGIPMAHKDYCPLYVAPVIRVTGCTQCDTTDEPHFHKWILHQSGRELF